MKEITRYWRQKCLTLTGNSKNIEITQAKIFFQSQIAYLDNVTDREIQQQLWEWLQEQGTKAQDAELCLRCWLSHQIEFTCRQLARKFGISYGFSYTDLLPFVLNDIILLQQTGYISLAQEILQSFNPQRGNLAIWAKRRVQSNRELQEFLFEHGVYLITDWAILNNTKHQTLSKILLDFHSLSIVESKQCAVLLEKYHQVYRQSRLGSGQKSKCILPNQQQLQDISYLFQQATNLSLSEIQILERLQKLADLIRQYRIASKNGKIFTQSLDDPLFKKELLLVSVVESTINFETAQQDFLQHYQQEVIAALDTAIQQVIFHKKQQLERNHNSQFSKFILGLYLFYCQGKTMKEIAITINFKAEYQVSRLLQLKEFRAEIEKIMLHSLLQKITKLAEKYTNSEQLSQLNQQLENLLEEQVGQVITTSETEIKKQNNHSLSLFSQRLCYYLCRTYQVEELI